jgi:hypothetical protein
LVSKLLLGATLSLFAIAPIVAVLQQGVLWQHSTYGAANAIALSSDGSYIAVGLQTGPASGSIQLYDKGGLLLWTRTVDRAIASISISANGSYIVAGGYQLIGFNGVYENGGIFFYDRNGTQLWNYTAGYDQSGRFRLPIFQVQLSNDGSSVVGATQSSTLYFDDHGTLLWSHNATSGQFVRISGSSNESYVAVADYYAGGGYPPNQVLLFNRQGAILWNSSAVTDGIDGFAMSRDGRFVAVGSGPNGENGTLYLYSTAGSLLWTRQVNSPPFNIAVSGDDSTIVIGTNWGAIGYNIQGDVVWTYNQAPAESMAVSSDGSYVLAGLWAYWQQTILILNNQGYVVWGKYAGTIHQVALSADDSYAAIAAGPSDTGTFSANSATIYFLPGPRTTTANTGTAYSALYFIPTLAIVPPASLLPVIPVASVVIIDRRKRSKNREQKAEDQGKDASGHFSRPTQ